MWIFKQYLYSNTSNLPVIVKMYCCSQHFNIFSFFLIISEIFRLKPVVLKLQVLIWLKNLEVLEHSFYLQFHILKICFSEKQISKIFIIIFKIFIYVFINLNITKKIYTFVWIHKHLQQKTSQYIIYGSCWKQMQKFL